jgi:hypothetical protein
MPRAGWVKPESDRRLSDLVSVGVLTRVFPPGLVDEVIAEAGRTQVRSRSLPARVMAYFAIGMALYSDGSYEDVLSQLSDGLAWASGWEQEYVLPSKSAIFQARARLGAKPLQALFERVAHPIATAPTAGETAPGWVAGRRLVAVDGTCLDLADTVENEAFFGRPGVNKGEQSAFPQARVVALAECGTHAIFAAVVGPLTTGEPTMMEQLLPKVQPGMLLLADRGAFSYASWRKASETGAGGCQDFCVSGLVVQWLGCWSDAGVESAGEGDREGSQGLVPALNLGSFDKLRRRLAGVASG